MSLTVIQKMRLCAAVVGGGAVIALTGAAVYYTQGADVTAAGNSSGASAVTTTPPNVPAIEKAVPMFRQLDRHFLGDTEHHGAGAVVRGRGAGLESTSCDSLRVRTRRKLRIGLAGLSSRS